MLIEIPAAQKAETFLDRHFHAAASMVLILTATNCFWLLGQAPVLDWDEARHGITAYEMWRHGDWIVNTYLDRPDYWNLKPPLGHWMTAASFWLFGPSAFSLRFMSAASAGFTVWLAMLLTRERHGGTAALLAGLILATTHGFVLEHAARSGHFDATLAFLAAATAFFLYKSDKHATCLAAVGGLLSLAFLLKSFAAFSLIAVTGVYLLWNRHYRPLARQVSLLFFLSLIIPVSAWVLARYRNDGLIFLKAMVGYDLLLRSSQTLEGHTGDPLFYLRVLREELGGWLSAMLVVAATNLTKTLPEPLSREGRTLRAPTDLYWIWALVPLALFTLARTKLAWYINLIYPPIAILLAVYTVRAVEGLPERALLKPIGGGIVWVAVLYLACVNERDILRDVCTRARAEDAAQAFVLSLPDELKGKTLFFSAEPRQAVLFAATAMKGLRVDVLPQPVFDALLHRMPATDLVAIELVIRKHLARGSKRLLRVGVPGDLVLLAAGEQGDAYIAEHGLRKAAQSGNWLAAQIPAAPDWRRMGAELPSNERQGYADGWKRLGPGSIGTAITMAPKLELPLHGLFSNANPAR